VNFEVPVVFERDVAHEEGVFVEAEEKRPERRQVSAVEGGDQQRDAGDVSRHLPQLLLDRVRPLRRYPSDAAIGVGGDEVQHPRGGRLRHPEERRVVVLQLRKAYMAIVDSGLRPPPIPVAKLTMSTLLLRQIWL